MKKYIIALALALAACGGDDGDNDVELNTAASIHTYLDGKTWVMTGSNIPSHPNGFNEDTNFGASSQCYATVTMAFAAQNVMVTSVLGLISGAANVGETGTCTHAGGGTLMFNSTNILIENVQGNAACFDFTATYTGFSQEGRGKISADGNTLTLELFFAGQATGHRCAAGAVGAQTVTLNANAFTGNAQQVYVRQ